MDPATALAIGSAGAGFGSGFFSPEGQNISSFQQFPFGEAIPTTDPFTGETRRVSIRPTDTLAEALGLSRSVLEQVGQRAQQPVSRAGSLPSAFVQNPAVWSGGGLPFDIGVTAFDAANPFHTPTAPPGGFSAAAQAFINGMQGGGPPGGPPGDTFSFGDEGTNTGGGGEPPPFPGPEPPPPTFDQFPKDPRPPEIIRDIPPPELDPGPPFDPPPNLPPPGGGDGPPDEPPPGSFDPGLPEPPDSGISPPGEGGSDVRWGLPPIIIPGPIIRPLSAQQQAPQGGFTAGFQQGNDFLRALEMLGAPMDKIRRRT